MASVLNKDALSATPLRRDALTCVEAALLALDTTRVIERSVERNGSMLTIAGTTYNLDSFDHVYVVAVGKCAFDAGRALETVLGERITEGLIYDVHCREGLGALTCVAGTHPLASKQNVEATTRMLALLERASERDLVLMVVSGGGSALLTCPVRHNVDEEQRLVKHLFSRGATIHELNTIRKHLSRARGGGLAAAAHPATVVALLFSDVPGNDLSTIASGASVRDTTTVEDARSLLLRYGAHDIGFDDTTLIETPKDEALFARVTNTLVLTNETALTAMAQCAEALGYRAVVQTATLHGEAREMGAIIARDLHGVETGTALFYGGETTVTIQGNGTGGRNEELSLGALPELADNELVLSFASDGRDNTEYAGGIADRVTRDLMAHHALDAGACLTANDSYTFFHTLQQGVRMGYTGANVADLVVALKRDYS